MVEDLVQKLSNPAVAFTTVPLNVDDPLYGMGNFAPKAEATTAPQITAQSEALGRGVDSSRHVVAKQTDGAGEFWDGTTRAKGYYRAVKRYKEFIRAALDFLLPQFIRLLKHTDKGTTAMMESYFVVPDKPILFDKVARKTSSVATLMDKSGSRRSGLVDAAAAPV